MPAMTFRQLVDLRYLAKGRSKTAVVDEIHAQSGISKSSLDAMYVGTRVLPETADRLMAWASEYHPGVELGRVILTDAPPRKRSEVDYGERAREAIETALRAAGLPNGFRYQVALEAGEWNVVAIDVRSSDQMRSGWRTGLGDALTSLRAQLVPAAPENDNAVPGDRSETGC